MNRPEPTPADMAAMREILAPVTEAERLEHAPAFCPAKEGENGFDFDTVKQALDLGQEGDARLFVAMYQGRFCFDKSAGRWFTFGPHSWREDILDEAMSAVSAVADSFYHVAKQAGVRRDQAERQGDKDGAAKAQKLQNDLYKRAYALRGNQYRRDVLTLAAAGADSLAVSGQEWDRNPWLLGCSNGVLNLETGIFRDGLPEDFIKTASSVEWHGLNAPCPQWLKFLDEILCGDKELLKYVQRVCGYILTGDVKEQVFFVLWGTHGRNGKGLLAEKLQKILGNLSIPIEAETLMLQNQSRSAGSASPDIEKFCGRRLAVASEPAANRRLDEAKVKRLTGSDELTGRKLYENEKKFFPSHKILLLTNHLPRVDADSTALWERIHPIEFPLHYTLTPTEQFHRLRDNDLPKKLDAELSGILAWMLHGCLAWQKEGLNPPAAVKSTLQKYRKNEDTFSEFLSDCCQIGPHCKASAKALWEAYEKWNSETGYYALRGKAFREKLESRFKKHRQESGNYYLGVGLLEGPKMQGM